jgi:hypothetical protein
VVRLLVAVVGAAALSVASVVAWQSMPGSELQYLFVDFEPQLLELQQGLLHCRLQQGLLHCQFDLLVVPGLLLVVLVFLLRRYHCCLLVLDDWVLVVVLGRLFQLVRLLTWLCFIDVKRRGSV